MGRRPGALARAMRYHRPVSVQGVSLGVRLRIDIGPRSSIGPGKIALLERIEASGSLSQAARELGMSYRRAWLLLDDLNHALAEPVTTASIGGAGGGGARLTPFGRELIAAYRDVEHASHDAAAARLAWLAQAGAHDPAGGASSPAASRPSTVTAIERRPVSRPLAPSRPKGARAARGPSSARDDRARPPGRRAPAAKQSSRAPKRAGRRRG